MNTIAKNISSNNPNTSVSQVKNSAIRAAGITAWYDQFIERLSFSHFGLIAMAILVGSCLGSIAAMSVFYYGAPIWVFSIGLFATMTNLVACIGQAPTKWVVNILCLSLVVNTTLIIMYPLYL
jgi:hypothetical protein